jgi:hypothetical protein
MAASLLSETQKAQMRSSNSCRLSLIQQRRLAAPASEAARRKFLRFLEQVAGVHLGIAAISINARNGAMGRN